MKTEYGIQYEDLNTVYMSGAFRIVTLSMSSLEQAQSVMDLRYGIWGKARGKKIVIRQVTEWEDYVEQDQD